MNKVFVSVFIAIYLSALFFCIFKRINAWPLSDYRAYQNHADPQYTRLYLPYFKLSDGSYFRLDMTKFDAATNLGGLFKSKKITPFINQSYFFFVFIQHDLKSQNRYIDKVLKSQFMQMILKQMSKRDSHPVKFVVMQVSFEEVRTHKWVPVYTPWREYDLP